MGMVSTIVRSGQVVSELSRLVAAGVRGSGHQSGRRPFVIESPCPTPGAMKNACTGTRNSKDPYSWAAGHTQPDTSQERRLRLAHLVWHQIVEAESEDIARVWFLGGQPLPRR